LNNLYEVSPRMQCLWELLKMKDSRTRNMSVGIVVEGAFNDIIFEKAINDLIDRHEALRTCFEERDGKVLMKVIKNKQKNLIIDTHLWESDSKNLIKDYIKSKIYVKFDFENDIKIKSWLFPISKNFRVVAFSIPHIVCDGVSINVLMKELFEIYFCYSDKGCKSAKLLDEAEQFKDYVKWLNSSVVYRVDNRYKNYWINQLRNKNVKQILPYDFMDLRLDKPVYTSEGLVMSLHKAGVISFHLNKNELSIMRETCREIGMSNSMFLMSVLLLLMMCWCATFEIISKLRVHGRTPEFLRTVGYLTNAIYFRFEADKNGSVEEYLSAIRDKMIDAIEHQYYHDVCIESDLGIASPRSLFFNFTPQSDWRVDSEELRIYEFNDDIEERMTMYDFEITSRISTTDALLVNIIFAYNRQLFKKNTISNLKELFLKIINSLHDNKKISLEEYINSMKGVSIDPLLTDADQ